MGRTITAKSLLAVEGKDECFFFKALLKHLNILNVQIEDIGGKDNFKNEFKALAIAEGFSKIERFGFVRDAENKPADSAFQSICNVLKSLNLPPPISTGEIIDSNGMKVGIFIMPDNTIEGMLENLCLETIKEEPVNDCVKNYISCISANHSDEEKLKFNSSKAKVQTLLASKVPIVNSLGLAAKKGYWNFEHSCFDEIKKFITNLFK